MKKEKCPFNKREIPPCDICENQSWEEKLYEEKPFIVPNGGDIRKVEITYQDWLWLEQFIQSLLSENTNDILRKFATGQFIKTPLAKKFEKQIKQEIIKGIKYAFEKEKNRYGFTEGKDYETGYKNGYKITYQEVIELIKGL